jgi:phosphomevalonate kinase
VVWAEAPGKLVLSGAYAVLDGAPALVAAVDRTVRADSSRPAEFVTEEFRAAEPGTPMPWFDASALRQDGRKLGLGSSAAILAATLGVLEMARDPAASPDQIKQRVFERALLAHRAAQGGGSGIDVAASVYGGVLCATLRPNGALELEPVTLPASLHLVALVSGEPASTRELVGLVKTFGARDPERYRASVAELDRAATAALKSARNGDAAALVHALDAQGAEFERLGELARANIVTDAVRELRALAQAENACILPAGAGGGDIVLFAGTAPMSEILKNEAKSLAHEVLELRWGAAGLSPSNEP